tara:strand:+ start:5970 stop:6146 length:177 start_codon:yes stop_codon:yes gene_type:complete
MTDIERLMNIEIPKGGMSEEQLMDAQDMNSMRQPLTESEALWRIELALLRLARALEVK